MKTNFLRRILPLGVMVLGVAGAFASNVMKQNEKAEDLGTFYHYDITKPVGERCVATVANCYENEGPVCTDSMNRQVWKLNIESGTACTTYLSRLPIN